VAASKHCAGASRAAIGSLLVGVSLLCPRPSAADETAEQAMTLTAKEHATLEKKACRSSGHPAAEAFDVSMPTHACRASACFHRLLVSVTCGSDATFDGLPLKYVSGCDNFHGWWRCRRGTDHVLVTSESVSTLVAAEPTSDTGVAAEILRFLSAHPNHGSKDLRESVNGRRCTLRRTVDHGWERGCGYLSISVSRPCDESGCQLRVDDVVLIIE
jgi:hypothetical protein